MTSPSFPIVRLASKIVGDRAILGSVGVRFEAKGLGNRLKPSPSATSEGHDHAD